MATSSTTFPTHRRALGLDEPRIVEALVAAVRVAGPANGGRFVGPHHVIDEDRTSIAAIEAMLAATRA